LKPAVGVWFHRHHRMMHALFNHLMRLPWIVDNSMELRSGSANLSLPRMNLDLIWRGQVMSEIHFDVFAGYAQLLLTFLLLNHFRERTRVNINSHQLLVQLCLHWLLLLLLLIIECLFVLRYSLIDLLWGHILKDREDVLWWTLQY
jgi:hypothetical protein